MLGDSCIVMRNANHADDSTIAREPSTSIHLSLRTMGR
jgi:hypothetical protein